MIKKIFFGVLVLVILSFAYYAISPLFISKYIDEVAPDSKPEISNTDSLVVQDDSESVVKESLEIKETILSDVIGNTAHPASGTVRIINTAEGDFVRYENFKTINGPDLYIYLANDLDAKDFVSLGKLKATEGNINYDIPVGIDVNDYRYVMVWCKRFGVLFNYADLSLAR